MVHDNCHGVMVLFESDVAVASHLGKDPLCSCNNAMSTTLIDHCSRYHSGHMNNATRSPYTAELLARQVKQIIERVHYSSGQLRHRQKQATGERYRVCRVPQRPPFVNRTGP